MKRTIKIKDLDLIIRNIPTTEVEDECNAWGCVTPHYTKMIEPGEIMYHVNKFLGNE